MPRFTSNEDLQIKHLTLALVRNAHSCLRAFEIEHPKGYEFDAIKNSFLRTFGKSWVDYDLQERSKLCVTDDPLGYVFHILQFLRETNPKATEETK